MSYTKPQLTTLGSAASAIQSGIHKDCDHFDNNSGGQHGTLTATNVAYEADE
jgi:hypothetical protein